MFDVFRFAWFAVRAALGLIALILAAYAALWLFVKILSMGPGNADLWIDADAFEQGIHFRTPSSKA